MADKTSGSQRALLVTGAAFLWVIALLLTLGRKGYIEAPAFVGGEAARSAEAADDEGYGEEPVSEIVIDSPDPEPEPARRRARAKAETPDPEQLEEPEVPTYSVWFESERSIGVCKISYEGGSKTANLHVSARVPEGPLAFKYRCGKYSGSGRINIKPKRVNGVLFCKDGGSVKVKTVRSKQGRCA